MTTMRDKRELVAVSGAGVMPLEVLTWLGHVTMFGVRFREVGDRLEVASLGEFSRVGFPQPAVAFLATHSDAVRRVLRATPPGVM